MLIKLDILKLTQAAAFLVKRYNGFITRIRLLKLLYIADRELIAQCRRPITGDNAAAMDFGPVLSHAYDLLKGEATGIDIWSKYIQQIAPYTHKLVADPGVGKLSKIELDKLDEVVQRYWWIDDYQLSQLTHQFPEWQRNAPAAGSSNRIPTEHILEALGLGNEVAHIRQEANAEAELESLLAAVHP